MKRVIVFSRVSTISQDVESQRVALIEEAHRLGYVDDDIVEVEFTESGISLEREERKGIGLLEKCIDENKSIECLIVWELSRIARRADIVFYVRDLLVKNKIRFIVLTPYIEVIDKNGQLSMMGNIMLGMFTTLAESEMGIKKERMKRGKEKRGSDGYYIGGWVAYGYKISDDRKIIVDEKEAEVVRKIFDLYLEGYSLRSIADKIAVYDKLNKAGIAQKKSGIRNILMNKAYIGESGRIDDSRGANRMKYPRIISDDIFYRVQEERKKHFNGEKCKHKHFYYCSALVYDVKSGYKLNGSAAMFRYQLDQANVSGKIDNISISINLLDSIALEVAYREIEKSSGIETDKEIEKYKRIIEEKENEKKVCENKIRELEGMIDKTNERIIKGLMDEDKGDSMILGFKSEIEDNQLRMNYLDNEISNGRIYLVMLESIGVIENDVRSIESDEERRNIIRRVIKKIGLEKCGEHNFNIYFTMTVERKIKLSVDSRKRKVIEDDKEFDYQYLKRFEYRYKYKMIDGVKVKVAYNYMTSI